MGLLLITYDLHRPGRNYPGLYEEIQALGPARWDCVESTWMVETDVVAKDAASRVHKAMDSNDELLVLDLKSSAWWSYGLNDECAQWLKDRR